MHLHFHGTASDTHEWHRISGENPNIANQFVTAMNCECCRLTYLHTILYLYKPQTDWLVLGECNSSSSVTPLSCDHIETAKAGIASLLPRPSSEHRNDKNALPAFMQSHMTNANKHTEAHTAIYDIREFSQLSLWHYAFGRTRWRSRRDTMTTSTSERAQLRLASVSSAMRSDISVP